MKGEGKEEEWISAEERGRKDKRKIRGERDFAPRFFSGNLTLLRFPMPAFLPACLQKWMCWNRNNVLYADKVQTLVKSLFHGNSFVLISSAHWQDGILGELYFVNSNRFQKRSTWPLVLIFKLGTNIFYLSRSCTNDFTQNIIILNIVLYLILRPSVRPFNLSAGQQTACSLSTGPSGLPYQFNWSFKLPTIAMRTITEIEAGYKVWKESNEAV